MVAIFLLIAASKFPNLEGVSLDGVILEGVLDGVGGMFSFEFLKDNIFWLHVKVLFTKIAGIGWESINKLQ